MGKCHSLMRFWFAALVFGVGMTVWGAGLFQADLPSREWVQFQADGFEKPVCGVIHRLDKPALSGVALGGLDTGCIDMETSGLWGYCTIFNSHVPRRGPINLPFLGLSVGGKTWVLCDPGKTKHYQHWGVSQTEPYPQKLELTGVGTVSEIHYWGHYPVADLEYATDAPVSVGLRAWSPFLPGDINTSLLPGAVFEVRLRNPGSSPQSGAIAFSFPGMTIKEANEREFKREEFGGYLRGVEVKAGSWRAPWRTEMTKYVLGVLEENKVRFGGELGADGAAWAALGEHLPEAKADQPGSSAAVDFTLTPGQEKTVRFVLTWWCPQWNGKGVPWIEGGHWFTHTYALRYRSARDAAVALAQRHEGILKRIIAWQSVIYDEQALPIWLRDSLINILYLITEDGMWAAADGPPIPPWVRKEDGMWGMDAEPRSGPDIEAIPCSFYGNLPIVYFFPELALSNLRVYKGYQFPEGAMPFTWGGFAHDARCDFVTPNRGIHTTYNGVCYASLVDRYALCRGDEAFAREFYESVKKNTIFTMNLRPDYPIGDAVIAMPIFNDGGWYEVGDPPFRGITTHTGGVHLAQLRIAEKMAKQVGDADFADQCRKWLSAGQESLEGKLWNGNSYLMNRELETGAKSDLIFASQLDGEWITAIHGLPGVFRKDRVEIVLDTLEKFNIPPSKTGVIFVTDPDGKPHYSDPWDSYGTYGSFPAELLMFSMNYMYNGKPEVGMGVAHKAWDSIVCRWGYSWNQPSVSRGDQDTGEMRGYFPGKPDDPDRRYGHENYQNMMLWALPAAMKGQDLAGPTKPGGLVARIVEAAKNK
jgi:uncharacterized protein (DUF608 family)